MNAVIAIIACSIDPDWPPADLILLENTNTSMTVQWNHVTCIHRNGEIDGYRVIYGLEETYGIIRNTSALISFEDTLQFTAVNLLPLSCYLVQVYSITDQGVDGKRSGPLRVCLTPTSTATDLEHTTMVMRTSQVLSVAVYVM